MVFLLSSSSSFTFSVCLRTFETLNKEKIHPRRLSIGGFLGPASGKTAIKLKARNCLTRGATSISLIDNLHLLKIQRHFVGLFCIQSNVSSISTNTVISGFWVGPDVEDGCGFVEAFVDRII